MEKNLSKEFREVMEETKAYALTSAMNASVFMTDVKDVGELVKAMSLLSRILNLYSDMFEKQDRLMDKMDMFMDKYLER